MKKSVSILLSLFLGLFVADAAISVLDDFLIVALGVHALDGLRLMLFLLSIGAAVVSYALVGVSPLVPKRIFLPLLLFSPLAALLILPVAIYHFAHLEQVALLISICQLLLGLGVLLWAQQGIDLAWPLVPEEKLCGPDYSWRNTIGFVLLNLMVFAPATLAYLGLCTSAAIDHFSGGFLVLRPEGFSARARTYLRDDGKSVRLIPMMHIAERDFYTQVSKSVPSNAVSLLEGVTDRRHLLKNKLSYNRIASSLGLAEQQTQFAPGAAQARHADVDVEQFSEDTLHFLNVAILVHSKGITRDTIRELLQPSPAVVEELWRDLLTKRNDHLLKEIDAELRRSDHIVVPWGAAHMPQLAREIQKEGFKLSGTEEFKLVQFRTIWRAVPPVWRSRP